VRGVPAHPDPHPRVRTVSRRLVVEADGGARGNPGPSAYGALVRDADTGELLVELAEGLGHGTNNVAEYSGLVAGLRAASQIDPDASVEARMDSKLVVEQMSGRWKIKHEDMRRLALQARDLQPRGGVRYTWIPREKNKAADALANESMDAVERGRSGHIERWLTLDASSPTGAADTVVLAAKKDAALEGGFAEDVATQMQFTTEVATPTPAIVGWGPDLGDPLLLTVLRHGVTEGTLAKQFAGGGGLDRPLVELGHSQARRAAAEIVARGPVDVLVCSPMLRAQQTAAAVAEATGLTPIVLAGLEECAFGEWDGLTFGAVAARWPQLMADWLTDPEVAPPGGESLIQVYQRVGRALAQLRRDYQGRHVVAVGHVGTVRALTARALGAPLLAMNRMELLPASLTTIAWYTDGNSSLRGYADSAHLRGLPTA
jgi:broad specificity phosphatase PhoE/ribonuclease HI